MASAQVLKKKEHLEAGKKKLEEFRRKKAAEKAKKTASSSHLHVSDAIDEKHPSEHEHVRLTDSNGVGTSDAPIEDRSEPSGSVPKNAAPESDTLGKSNFSSSLVINDKHPLPARNNDSHATVLQHSILNNEKDTITNASVSFDGVNGFKEKLHSSKDGYSDSSIQVSFEIGNDDIFNDKSSTLGNRDTSHSALHGLDKYQSSNIEKDGKSGMFVSTANVSPVNPVSTLLQEKLGSYLNEDNNNQYLSPYPAFASMGDKRSGGAVDYIGSTNHSSPWTTNNRYAEYKSDAQSSSNISFQSSPASVRRSRPSFLDSIKISKDSSSSPALFDPENADTSSSKVQVDGLVSPVPHIYANASANASVASGNEFGTFSHAIENKHDFFSQKQNDDFAALEQHIEDLTQEKFSLQRALEASRALSESLASENSALTESFNQQGSVVNQLKFELEELQAEIRAQMAELEAVRVEYGNAQLECNAADERAKLLASEVIGLEEKSLRLRSNELKLERQLQSTQTEISSYRKKMSSLEKDRQDLQSTIDALQEEKKLLQSKLRKASSGKSTDFSKTSNTGKNVSTSTEDLDDGTTESTRLGSSDTAVADEDPTTEILPENIDRNLEGLSLAFPSDQIRMIQNINTLIAELTLEKDQLMQALSAESSQSSTLLELNKELARKLEIQTQRLELLTAQSMAKDVSPAKHLELQTVHENTTYADEGDEVVERVLGWIMKLFPGGPSRRRPSKHL